MDIKKKGKRQLRTKPKFNFLKEREDNLLKVIENNNIDSHVVLIISIN